MKTVFSLALCCLLGLTMFCMTGLAESINDERLEIVDQVSEMAPDGSYLQIGDYGITEVDNVWEEKIPGEIKSISLSRIKTGATVKVRIIPKGTTGFWVAENLYLLIDSEEKSEVTSQPSSGDVYLENGTWKN